MITFFLEEGEVADKNYVIKKGSPILMADVVKEKWV